MFQRQFCYQIRELNLLVSETSKFLLIIHVVVGVSSCLMESQGVRRVFKMPNERIMKLNLLDVYFTITETLHGN